MDELFDGFRYTNSNPYADQRSLRDVLRWLASGRKERWPLIASPQYEGGCVERVEKKELRVTFVNHSTLLIQKDGLNILTDPIWSERCSPFSWMGPRRVTPPGIPFYALPPIDVVLVSHNHYDHMDRNTLKALYHRHHPQFIVSKGNRKRLLSWGIESIDELGWWEEKKIAPNASIQCVPAQHFSRRGLFDRNRTLWCGFVIHGESKNTYFAGDTGYGEHFQEILKRCGPINLACLPIGAYLPRWFMQGIHMGPQEAVQAHIDLKTEISIPIHFGTFQLSDETVDQPVRELLREMQRRGVPFATFPILGPGGVFQLSNWSQA